ncbi:hypothetical protein F2Q68_00025909 [Brassica cretica]|uniref:Transposase-associated domain-containing protein n=1 Tax=Brassica cretica TaxID=69181 RepID=A0A8S9IAT1_BRACR|nr:hypothetical protein F2Q68_00025909 [Brassica cretica]
MDRPHLDPNTKLLTEEYAEGVGEFMRLVHQQPEANTGMLRCLCSSCNNNRILKEWDVRTHLYMRGFTQNYKVWCLHGENGYEYGSTSEPQHVESIFVCSIRMSLVPCRLSSLFSNPAESILHPYPQGYTTWFNKSKNGISRCINKMMYFMLRKGYPTYSVIPNDECHLWFRNFAQHFNWESGHTETVRQAFHEKTADTYTKQIYESRGGDVSKNIKSIWVVEVGSQSWLLVKPRMTFAPTESRSITFPQDSRLFDENPVPCNLLLIVKDIQVDVGLAMNSRKLSLLVAIPAEYPLRMLSSVWLWSSLSDGRNP